MNKIDRVTLAQKFHSVYPVKNTQILFLAFSIYLEWRFQPKS